MTDLDDALNTSAPAMIPPNLTAVWKEVGSTIPAAGNPDASVFLDDQMDGVFEVTHSFDDGLPDPVTMTTGNDASGKMTVPLIGKPGLTAVDIGWRGTRSATGSVSTPGTFSSVLLPTTNPPQVGDYLITCLSVPNQTAAITQLIDDGGDPRHWKLLGTSTDGATQKLYIYGRSYWDGLGAFQFTSNVALNWSATMVTAYARGVDPRSWVDFKPRILTDNQTSGVAVTTHTSPEPIRLNRRGFIVGVWGEQGNTGGAMTPQAPQSQLVQVNSANGSILVSTSTLTTTTDAYYQVTATTAVATNIVMMAVIALELVDRPQMDARQYFSPFNVDSPVYDFERDTAITTLATNHISPVGPISTTIFTGQMESIGVKGRQAEMNAVSATRLALDKSLVLPVVSGYRENCSVDWLATWAMARGGQYAGPAPTIYTRMWAPMYGSTHAHYASEFAYGASTYWDSAVSPSGPYGVKPPPMVPGPFMTAMFGKLTNTRADEIFFSGKVMDQARSESLPLPGQPDAEWQFNDQMSQANNSGRVIFWVRADPAATAPTYFDPGEEFLFRHQLYLRAESGVYLGYVICEILPGTRRLSVRMGADHTGSTTVVFSSQPAFTLPTDGTWHFIGVKWNFGLGQVEVNIDGQIGTSSSYATNGDNDTTVLPVTEDIGIANGNRLINVIRSRMPISDILLEAGAESWTRNWADHYPSPVGLNAVMRPTYQPLRAVAESTPIQGWDLLVQLAQATSSAYRTNESDNFEFLPPSYFGEIEQLTPVMVADTEVNAGELDVISDPSKTRNVVTVNYPETRVDTNISPVLALSSSIELTVGITDIVFALDKPTAEIHWASDPFGTAWTLTNLTGPQVANPSTIPAGVHYLSANDAPDGTGTPLGQPAIIGRIISATASTITIRFTNNRIRSGYLANSGNQVPFLMILGYAVTTSDAYVTQRDQGSITHRRERPLTSEIGWIQDRATATDFAQRMVTSLSRARPQVSVEVMADPRRVPGEMLELADSQGTRAEGTWRVMSVTHHGEGPKYTQTLSLVNVNPMAIWDEDPGWDRSVWAP